MRATPLRLAVALLLTACAPPEGERPPALAFDTAAIALATPGDTVRLTVEVARTPDQRAYGLKDRPTLAEGAGMLFVFDSVQGADEGFWMWRTLVPLDIAFIDSTGSVGTILSMEPCDSPYAEWCEPYVAGVRFLWALEMNEGWFERNGVGVGARLLEAPTP